MIRRLMQLWHDLTPDAGVEKRIGGDFLEQIQIDSAGQSFSIVRLSS